MTAGASSTSRSTWAWNRAAARIASVPPEAGADERDRAIGVAARAIDPRELCAELFEHARHGQARKIRPVEIRAMHLDAVLAQSLPEVTDLRRLRGRREPVEVEDSSGGSRAHSRCWHPGRQRHLIWPSPSVL